MSKSRIALFVAGDERIYFPALVALVSVEHHNPGDFDRFMCFDRAKVTDEQLAVLQSYGIEFLDSKSLDQSLMGDQFRKMRVGTWPIDIFYNWILPEYFRQQGYAYSVKCDYDILCVDKYDLENLLPGEGQAVSGLLLQSKYANTGPSAKTRRDLAAKGEFNPKDKTYLNVGFVAFNHAVCSEINLVNRFADMYNHLYQTDPKTLYLEQAALAILLTTMPGMVKDIGAPYNQRAPRAFAVAKDLTFDVKNIHYNTKYKPWRPIDGLSMRRNAQRGWVYLYAYRNIWLDFASQVTGFETYCHQRKLDERKQLGLFIKVLSVQARYGKRLSSSDAGRTAAAASKPDGE